MCSISTSTNLEPWLLFCSNTPNSFLPPRFCLVFPPTFNIFYWANLHMPLSLALFGYFLKNLFLWKFCCDYPI